MLRFFLLLAIVLILPPAAYAEPTLDGKVTRIVDGDTFRMGKVRVRLWGVDAPERDTPSGPGATRHLSELIAGQDVSCVITGVSYERLVGQCRVGERDISALMASDGWARDYQYFSQGHYAAEEKRARDEQKGMWASEKVSLR